MENQSEHINSSSIEETKRDMLQLFLPNIIVLGIYIFIGIVGNTIVIHIYRFKMRESTDNRFFIPCLAAGDMSASTVCGTSAIILHIFLTNFKGDIACKVMWFSMTWSASSAAMILVFIAFQRYKRICCPLENTTLLDKKWSVIFVLYIFSMFVSSPLLFTSGISKYRVQPNDTFYVCERIGNDLRRDWRLEVAYSYTGFEALIVLSIASLLTTFYMKVGKQLILHFKLKCKRHKETNNIKLTIMEAESTGWSHSDMETSKTSASKSPRMNRKNQTIRSTKAKKKSFNHQHRYTFIFIAISAICIVTYSPRLLLMILESVNETFWIDFYENTFLMRMLKFLNRLHIVNNIANPFLYAMFDHKFKKQLLRLVKC